jgi:hypothetical protein
MEPNRKLPSPMGIRAILVPESGDLARYRPASSSARRAEEG